jgi:formylglycine-generating enzyme required for sulfatase activity
VEGDTNCRENEKKPAETKTVSSFWLMETEVTVKAYEACAAAGACDAQVKDVDIESTHTCNWKNGRSTHPMNCVNWSDAGAFCRWAGGRLPSAVEWEYAAKSGRAVIYPWGNEAVGPTRANYCDKNCPAALDAAAQEQWKRNGWVDERANDGYAGTAPVGSYAAGTSPWGLKDMAGNVSEWTGTDHDAANKELRGGGWHLTPVYLRASVLDWLGPTSRDGIIGFRCAQSP